MMRFVSLALFAALFLPTSADARPVLDKPMYDPVSKSYFELHKVTRDEDRRAVEIPELPFDQAERFARQRTFKGVRGRLAVVKSNETHLFLMQNFQPDLPVWIGLRYYCKLRELRWVSGEKVTRKSFQAWDPNWDQSGNAGCIKGRGQADWMSVCYSPVQDGFRWVMKGARKHYVMYFVEYPTGKP